MYQIHDGLAPLGTESDGVLAVIPKSAENRPPKHLPVPALKLNKSVEPSKQIEGVTEVQRIGDDLPDSSKHQKDLEVLESPGG